MPVQPHLLAPSEVQLLGELDHGIVRSLNEPPLVIQSWVIQWILLGYPLEYPVVTEDGTTNTVEFTLPLTGLHLSNCIISGHVTLDYASRSNGSPLPPLTASYCLFLGTICAQQAHLQAIRLNRCGILGLNLDAATVVQSVELMGCTSRRAWLQTRGANPAPTLLRILELGPDVAPASMCRTSIGKVLSFQDSAFSNESLKTDDSCIMLNYIQVGCDVRFDKAVVSGGVSLQDASVSGSVFFNDAKISGSARCLNLYGTKVRGSLLLDRLTLSHDVCMNHVSVGHNLSLLGASIGKNPDGNFSLATHHSRVGGDLFIADDVASTKQPDKLRRLATSGTLEIVNAEVGGNLYMKGVDFSTDLLKWDRAGRTMLIPNPAQSEALLGKKLTEAVVEIFQPENWHIDQYDRCTLIDLEGTQIGGVVYVDLDVPSAARRDEKVPAAYYVRLSQAKAASFEDFNTTGWGYGTKLDLDGFETLRLVECQHLEQTPWAKLNNSQSEVKFISFLVNVSATLLEIACVAVLCFAYLRLLRPEWFWLPFSLFVLVEVAFGLYFWFNNVPSSRIPKLLFATLIGQWISFWGLGDQARFYRSRLNRQYIDPAHPRLAEFHPGVYENLARQLSNEGYDREARAILSDKYRIHRCVAVAWFARPIWRLFDLCFDHGFSPLRSLTTMALLLFVGGLVVKFANSPTWIHPHESVLVLSTSTVNTLRVDMPLSAGSQERNPTAALAQPISPALVPSTDEIPCGSHIDPYLYAADLFVPALDLRQATLCEISSTPKAKMRFWRAGRAFYTILGWLVTSITVLSIPGYLRRRAEKG